MGRKSRIEERLKRELQQYIRAQVFYLRKRLGAQKLSSLFKKNASMCVLRPKAGRPRLHASWRENGRTHAIHILSGDPSELYPILLAWWRLKHSVQLLRDLLRGGGQEERVG